VKVLHVIIGLGTGGAETQLVNLATAPRPDAPEIVIADLMPASDSPNESRLREAGIETHHLGLTGILTLARTRRRLARLISAERPDVLQSWMYYADILSLSALRRSGRLGETRLYWGVRCSDMELSRYRGRLRRAVKWCAKRSAVPDGVVVNSLAGRDAHERLGYRPRVWHLIENGIDTTRFAPGDRVKLRHQLGLPQDARIAVHAARVDPMKDQDTLLAVAARLPDWTFVAAGEGTDRLDGPSNFLGLGRQAEMERLYGAADVILSTSAFGEGFSNVIAEGMACEAVPVATEVGDGARIVGDTGYLAPPRDTDALAAHLSAVAGLSAKELALKRQAARARIVERFSVARMVERFDTLHRTGELV
jgi:glycosyltransferase involved in cell wall biosynthesis